jgi:hypothetical protein
MSSYSIPVVVTVLQVGRARNCSNSDKRFFSSPERPYRPVKLTTNLSGSEVKNEWSYTSTPLYAFMACTETALPFVDG